VRRVVEVGSEGLGHAYGAFVESVGCRNRTVDGVHDVVMHGIKVRLIGGAAGRTHVYVGASRFPKDRVAVILLNLLAVQWAPPRLTRSLALQSRRRAQNVTRMLTPEQEALRAELGLPETAGPEEVRLALVVLEATSGPLDRAAFAIRLGSRLELLKAQKRGSVGPEGITVGAYVAAYVLIGLFGLAVVFFAARSSWTPWLRVPVLLLGLAMIADSVLDIYRKSGSANISARYSSRSAATDDESGRSSLLAFAFGENRLRAAPSMPSGSAAENSKS
jgi:hypothetical protein